MVTFASLYQLGIFSQDMVEDVYIVDSIKNVSFEFATLQSTLLRTDFLQCDRIGQDRSRDDAPGCLHRLLTCLHAQPLPLIVFMCGVEVLNDPVQ